MATAIAVIWIGSRSESPSPAEPNRTPTTGGQKAPPTLNRAADRATASDDASGKHDAAPSDTHGSNGTIPETQLPIKLLGTMVGQPASLSEAVILNTEMETHFTLGVGDSLLYHRDVKIVEIDRQRILLSTSRGLEELVLNRSARGDYAGQVSAQEAAELGVAANSGARKARRKPLSSTAQLAKQRGAGISDELVEAMDRMVVNFANDLEPSYNSSGEIDGLRATDITEGGLLEEAGVTREDVLQGINGVKITSTEGAKRVLRDLANCQPMTGMIMGRTGEREVEFTAEMLQKFECVQ